MINFEIDSDEIIEAIRNTKTLLASSSGSGRFSGSSGSVKLFMTLTSFGSGLKPEYSVSGEIDGEEFAQDFTEELAELHGTSTYPLENAVMNYNYYARQIS